MSYLPESMLPLEETEFPKAYDKDLHMQVRMMHEAYSRFYPQIEYYTLYNRYAPAPGGDVNYPASERSLPDPVDPGGGGNTNPDPEHVIEIFPQFGGNMGVTRVPNTQFDMLWGESIPEVTQDEGWVQPHDNPSVPAVNKQIDKHKGPYYIHARVQREPKEKELKKIGFDKVRDLLIYIPLVFFDEYGIRVEAGDYFIWDDTRWEVKDQNRVGYWKNTNVRLFMAINAEHMRSGS